MMIIAMVMSPDKDVLQFSFFRKLALEKYLGQIDLNDKIAERQSKCRKYQKNKSTLIHAFVIIEYLTDCVWHSVGTKQNIFDREQRCSIAKNVTKVAKNVTKVAKNVTKFAKKCSQMF